MTAGPGGGTRNGEAGNGGTRKPPARHRRRPAFDPSGPTKPMAGPVGPPLPAPTPGSARRGTPPAGPGQGRSEQSRSTGGRPRRASGRKAMTLGRASGTMAIGTVASRASGFLRTVAIAAAIGTGAVGDAYNVANTTPNILYDLLLGGVLSSVIVPVLVRAAKDDPDEGEAFASSLLTLVVLGLGATVAVAMLAAPLIISAYLAAGGAERDLAVTFLRWFLPQVIFYGLGATIGAILNVRQSFAAPMFVPVLNNLIVIATCVAFIFVPGPRPPTVAGISDAQITVLAAGTTLGVVIMTLALLPSLRAVGFRYRPRLDLSHPGLRRAMRLAGWTLLYVAVSQVGYLVIVRLASSATAYTVYTYGYQIFQLPYAVIAVSVITALLPRMSAHAADNRSDLVRQDLSTGTRLAAVVIVPAALALLALGRPIAVAVFNHGAVSYTGAVRIGDTLAAFAVALVPFSLFQVQLRVFYAHQDSRTPALINMGIVATNIACAAALSSLLPDKNRSVALALAFAVSYLVGVAVSSVLLQTRLGGIDGGRIARMLTQVTIAGGLGAVVAAAVSSLVRMVLGQGWIGSGVSVVLACGVGVPIYLAAIVRMRLPEMAALVTTVRGRFGSRSAH
ncbi:integral membrane protein MviN [Candidatus Protofrankia californiensis]|uniref:Probable lipid II flippase MurJ n=2 Tax=Protofrankia TaxID=2994361 RepID=A0A1C3PH61_9ACTN|nr:integral membrane protein MviN [Candidatus Protofrankia californiensis]